MIQVDSDPHSYNVDFLETPEGLIPLCPVCRKPMGHKSNRRGDTLWECTYTTSEDEDTVKCNLIEGRLDARRCMLWGIHYEARAVEYKE